MMPIREEDRVEGGILAVIGSVCVDSVRGLGAYTALMGISRSESLGWRVKRF